MACGRVDEGEGAVGVVGGVDGWLGAGGDVVVVKMGDDAHDEVVRL